MPLDPRVAKLLREKHDERLAAGEILPPEELERYLDTFRARFAPHALGNTDGPALLELMHGRGNNDSLMYWLEFKDDDEFPGNYFGGIGGGSALKFGIYIAADSKRWFSGPATNQTMLSEDKALEFARRQREQLLAGCQLLGGYRTGPTPVDYARLEEELTNLAPDVADTSWGHKYFSLMFPDLLDDYHAASYQRYYLTKTLVEPHDGKGRYVCAGQIIGIAEELGIPASNLAKTMNHVYGRPHKYWRVGTGTEEKRRWAWPAMQDGNFIAIGWDELGDLGWVEPSRESKEDLREAMNREYKYTPQLLGRKHRELFKFLVRVNPGDIVLACDGSTVLGIARVEGDYYFQRSDESFAHRRPVKWLDTAEWKQPEPEGLRTTFVGLTKNRANLLQAERHILDAVKAPPPRPDPTRPQPGTLHPTVARIERILRRKSQVVLYGPPGTGKTHFALGSAKELAARSWFGQSYDSLGSIDQKQLISDDLDKGAVEVCCFHPAYGYEDFLEGFRPDNTDGSLTFELKDGVFKRLADRATANSAKPHYLVIDEINRGDIPRIFGELMLALEKDKRGLTINLAVSGRPLTVPANLFIIGTMNTADRSIALLDTALRRRFGFVELMPDSSLLDTAAISGLPLGPWLDSLNQRLVERLGHDARNLQVGHSYLLRNGRPLANIAIFAEVLRDDIVPLLEEYCYEDYEALADILGTTLVDRPRQRVRIGLFRPDQHDDLIQALNKGFPDLITTPEAVASESFEATEEDSDTDSETDDA